MTSDEAYTAIGVCLDSLRCPTPHHRLWRAVIAQTLVDSMANKRRTPKRVGKGRKRTGKLLTSNKKDEAYMLWKNSTHNNTRDEARVLISDGWLQGMMPERTANRLQAAVEWSWDESNETRRRLIELVSYKTKDARI